ncbi:fatty acid synthase-like [Melitaea cinxia]|uniref:fatty acid synthase-like n=1 Tax=Melitaea cinxia TaxID=113334 RepID=UPI001E27459E|nr:fatty acid synthase-like [Melitaea cinxia]
MEPKTKTFDMDVDMGAISGEKIVISGMAGLYPESHNVKELSHILYNKINPINAENFRWKYDHPEVAQYTGKVPELDLFDAQFFKVHYRLGNNMDPLGRKILEQAYQAIYDAGINPTELDGKKVCVYVGTCFSETEKACFYAETSTTGLGITGCNRAMFANRISYWLNAKGPSMAVDSACVSSTGALELAYKAITRGECEAAIVGGAHLCLHPQSTIHYGRTLQLSMDGKTKSFDNDPTGCAKSEAINILFLQKAKDARRIYAEVVHVKSEFNLLPKSEKHARHGFYRNPSVMAKFIKDFYEEAKIKPEAVEYVEAFGSANAEADKAELEAIEEVYCSNRNDPLLIGSVMSNIGYGEAATGISAVTKVLLAYHTGKIAANLHCEVPRQDVAALREGRMRVVTDHQEFGRIYTAVNGLSETGVTSHILLNGHYKPKDLSRYKSSIPQLVTISGRQESSVMKIFEDIKTRPIDPEELALFRSIHKTSVFGHMGRGYTILDTNDKNETISLSEKVDYFNDVKRPLWFVYSGMGSQWAGMGAQLMRIPIFAASIERCRQVLEPKGIDIVHIITSPDKTIFDNILNSFVGIAAVQIGLTDILSEMGIFPDNIIGHSVGELGCAYADGCSTAEEMILSAYSRGLVSLQTPFIRGSMAAVGVGFQQISKLCPPEIEVACHNGPDSCTISGPADIMKEFVADLTSKHIFAKEVPCSNIAYHSRYIAEAGPGLLKYLTDVIKSPKQRSERWLSTSVPQERWGEPLAKYSSAEYHTNNLLNPVLFEETSALIPPNAVLVEIAPHGLLQAILKRSLPESCKHIPLTRRGHPDNATFFLEAIGKLYMEGYNPKLEAIYPKIEYPVSTGTPMLSHLVEWAHNERWNLPLYVAAHRKTAAASKFVTSTQDDGSAYLKGHVIRGKLLLLRNIYPFAAVLVAVWDTLAMSLGAEKKTLSVVFKEVQQYSQLVLYDQRQVTLNVTLLRGTGRFEVLSNKTKVASGYINANTEKKEKIVHATKESDGTMTLDSKDIYNLLNSRDYNYSGDFRSIYNANQTLDEANILWKNNWVTFIDGLIQLNALRRHYESVSQLHTVKKIVIDVDKHLKHMKIFNDGTKVLNAKICVNHDRVSCGGVDMFTLRFYDLPSVNSNVALKTVQFVPHLTKDKLDKTSALYVILQVLAENLKKQEISVAEIVDNKTDEAKYYESKNNIDDIPGILIQYSTVRREEILKQRDFLKDVDVVLVNNLSNDENLAQALLQVRKRNSFLINNENTKETAKSPSFMLYHTVCAHTTGPLCIELALLHPTQVQVYYAGINDVEVKKKNGFMALDENNENTLLDFSGTTENGDRVMGIVCDKSIKTTVRASPDLLWPVPDHWSLEDAATVPLAYCLAFYCLRMKSKFFNDMNILVHGGTGALGQAVISIALAHGYQVFTTVSDIKKKQFLLRLFPDLKEEYIGNSRDITFADTVLNATKGLGVNIVISCARGEIKNATLRCCSVTSTLIDTSVLLNREEYNFGMNYLLKSISYVSIDMYSVLELHKKGELKELQAMLSEGIARGYVRPLSRVTYSAPLAPRAYRLQAASRHRGRVLLDLRGEPAAVHPHRHRGRVLLDLRGEPAAVHPHRHRGRVLLDLRGEPAAVHPHRHRGRVLLDLRGEPAAVHPHRHRGRVLLDLRGEPAAVHPHNWKSQGINVELLDKNILRGSLSNIVKKNKSLKGIEGIYYVLSPDVEATSAARNFEQLLLTSQISQSTLKYLAIINTGNDCWVNTIAKNIQENVTLIKLPNLKMDSVNKSEEAISVLSAVNAIEQALCSKQRFVIIHSLKQVPQLSLVDEVALITGIQITKDTPRKATLRDLGVDGTKLELLRVHLRDVWLTLLSEEEIDLMTISNFIDLGESFSEKVFKETKGLETFISYIDCDELLATTEMVFLPSLTNISNECDDEFDVNQTYLCVVPGADGHHARFRTLCERSKLPALVMQPGLDDPHETVRDIADRFAKTLLKKTKVPDGFYLLGYESGVMVALEMAAILEDKGLTGTVFCLGGTPKEIQEHFAEILKDYKTDDELQNAVIRHMYTLLTNNENTEKLDSVLSNQLSWNEKVSACVNLASGQVVHSNQYTEELIKAAYGRILQVRRYNYEPRQLRSQVIFIRPRSSKICKTSNLQQYSLKPVIQYEVQAPFAFAAEDLSCSNIVNRHLDPAILAAFEKKNLCETYVLDTNCIMSNAFNQQ